MIIVLILLIVAVVGLCLYKFVFSGKKSTEQQPIVVTNPPAEEAESTIAVGDYVDYVPDDAENYILTEEISGSADNLGTGIEQEELKWRILSINDDGTIDIISTEPISTEIYLKGAVGFNNGVYLLNDICKELYSNEELGVEARSLNIEDIENKMNETGIEERDAYTLNEVAYGDKKTYTDINAYLPEIYTKVSMNASKESIAYYEEPTINTFIQQTNTEMTQTFYKIEDIKEDYFEDVDFYEIVFDTQSGSLLASRCVDCSSTCAYFGINTLEDNVISGSVVCASNGKSGTSKGYIRPVITLSSDIELSEEGGDIDNPRTLNY